MDNNFMDQTPEHQPLGYYGWSRIHGHAGHVTLKDVLHNLDKSSGGDSRYARGVLVGVVSTLVATGMEFNDAYKLAWQHMPTAKNRLEDCIPVGWETEKLPVCTNHLESCDNDGFCNTCGEN